jgi:hypothetical protein
MSLRYIEEGEFLMNRDHKDRGMKKWNGFFMPETIKMLKDLWEDDHKTSRPHLNETKIERWNGYYLKAWTPKCY